MSITFAIVIYISAEKLKYKSGLINNFFSAFLTTMMLNVRDDVWIGLNDVNWEMRFLWTDGKGVQFTNWAKGYPVSVPDGRRAYGVDVSALLLL